MTAPCFVVAGYSLILGDDNAGAYAAVIAADKLLQALDIRIAQADMQPSEAMVPIEVGSCVP